MENVDSKAKQAALDNKSAYAGNVSPDPEIDIERLGEQAGLHIRPGHPLSIADDFDRRDQNRYELDVDAQVSDKANATEAEEVEVMTADMSEDDKV